MEVWRCGGVEVVVREGCRGGTKVEGGDSIHLHDLALLRYVQARGARAAATMVRAATLRGSWLAPLVEC